MTSLVGNSSRGFIYVAWGDKFIQEAVDSAARVKSIMPYPITLVSPEPITGEHPFDQVIISSFEKTYRDKIKMRLSPYQETIFLDTDTHMLSSFDQVFDLLQRFDIAYQPSAPSNHYALEGVPMLAFDEPSAGLIAWRRNLATDAFFDLWDAEYTREEQENGNGAWDQRSMRAALWQSDVRLTPLSKDWQLYSFETNVAMNTVKMVHGRGVDAKSAVNQCNQFIGPRLYIPKAPVTRIWNSTPSDYFKLGAALIFLGFRRLARLSLHWTGLKPIPQNTRPM